MYVMVLVTFFNWTAGVVEELFSKYWLANSQYGATWTLIESFSWNFVYLNIQFWSYKLQGGKLSC